MRKRFYELATRALDDDPRVAIVLAEIGASELPARHERVFNVGIREQLMIGVAAGLALEGLRPIVHSYAPFLVERAVRADQARPGPPGRRRRARQHRRLLRRRTSGRTHQAPGDVALLSALPGWTIHVPGHPDELERVLAAARSPATTASTSGCPRRPTRAGARRRAAGAAARRRDAAPVVVAVGPTLDETLAATPIST